MTTENNPKDVVILDIWLGADLEDFTARNSYHIRLLIHLLILQESSFFKTLRLRGSIPLHIQN